MESNGAYLKRMREKAGLSQRRLADLTGVSYSTISKLEQHVNDVRLVPAITALRLAHTLGISVGQLLGMEPR